MATVHVAMCIVAVLVASGFMLALSAIVEAEHQWMWPMLNAVCALAPLMPLLLCGGMDEILRLLDSAIDYSDRFNKDSDSGMIGWFIAGASIVTAFASPVLVAQLNVISAKCVWLSAGGSWLFMSSLLIGIAFIVRFQHKAATNQEEEEEEE